MKIKKAATILFDAVVLVVFTTMSVLIFCGFYKAIEAEQPKPIQSAPIRTAPIRTVTEQPVPVQTVSEVVEVVVPEVIEYVEPEVIEIECIWVEPVETVPNYSEADLENLALVIYQEAGSDVCSDETRMMVGNVVLNRVADDRFPNTIEEVLLQERQYGLLHWTGLVWPERASYMSEAHAVQRAYDCAERLLNGERLLPDDVVFQAEFGQGTEIVVQQDGFYFCR